MKLVNIKIRKKWQIFNSLYNISKKDIVEGISSIYYSEDALFIETSVGLYIDIGWYHGYKENERRLIGMIIENYDWDNPLEEKEFETVDEAIIWTNDWIKKIEKLEDSMTKEEKKKKMEELKRKFEEINR